MGVPRKFFSFPRVPDSKNRMPSLILLVFASFAENIFLFPKTHPSIVKGDLSMSEHRRPLSRTLLCAVTT